MLAQEVAVELARGVGLVLLRRLSLSWLLTLRVILVIEGAIGVDALASGMLPLGLAQLLRSCEVDVASRYRIL